MKTKLSLLKSKKHSFWLIMLVCLLILYLPLIVGWSENIQMFKNKSDIDYGRYVVINHRLFDVYTCFEVEPFIFSTLKKDNIVYIYGLTGYTIIKDGDTLSKAKKIIEPSYKDFPPYVEVIYYKKPVLIEKLLAITYVDNAEDIDESVKNKLKIDGKAGKKIFYDTIKNLDTKAKQKLMIERNSIDEEEENTK